MRTPEPIQSASDSNISVGELRQRLSDPGLTIVDVRDLPAYNGWRLGGTARGGHIPGAVAFPGAWLKSVDDPEVERLLRSRGSLPAAKSPSMAIVARTLWRSRRGWQSWATSAPGSMTGAGPNGPPIGHCRANGWR